jgi:DNA polymerase-4
MVKQTSLPFNPKEPTIIHLDLNSCFAKIEQQANPKLRDKPVAVAAFDSPSGCIIAPSVEAKKLGIKVGMRVREGKLIFPNLIVLTPDAPKYRSVHLALKKILSEYSDKLTPASIDEFILDIEGCPAQEIGIAIIAKEIKEKIKEEIGDYLTVSVGIAPNRFLAKTAAGLHKPDGLDQIDKTNFWEIYKNLKLTDLCGIKTRNAIRLANFGIFTVCDFYESPIAKLKVAFHSICGYWWYLRLHGWEIDNIGFSRKSFGNSVALGKILIDPSELSPILHKLTQKTGTRMRKAGFWARGVHLSVVFRDWDLWHHGLTLSEPVFDSRDIYKAAFKILLSCPKRKPVRTLAESVFNLSEAKNIQLDFFEETQKRQALVSAVDKITDRFGNFVVTPAKMLGTGNVVLDRIAFSGIRELEEMIVW